MSSEVVPITPPLVRPAAAAVARGFETNSIWLWLVGGPRRLRWMLSRHYRAMIRHVFMPRRAAWTTADALGAALWFPPGTLTLSGREQLLELASMLPETFAGLGRGLRWERLITAHRPREPHWYLNVLSVDPAAQRRGVGTALIAPGLERCDADGLGAYLETQERSNIPFYRRFGFEENEELALPDSPPVWTMWRPPVDRGAPLSRPPA